MISLSVARDVLCGIIVSLFDLLIAGSFENDFGECVFCHSACEGCHGSSDSDCIACATGR